MCTESLIFEKGNSGHKSTFVGGGGIPPKDASHFLPATLLRSDLPLPSCAESEVVRHYLRLARRNYAVDTNFYPLGSCTMKYNPKLNETMASLEGFTQLHPYQQEQHLQGALELIWRLEELLCAITGMQRFTFQPSSGAHGELAGMLMIKKYHTLRGEKRKKVIVPDSAHGTNPATASMCGYETVVVESNKEGLVDVEKLQKLIDEDVAAMMLTNPNTLGLFEEEILTLSELIHRKGGLLYYDGANFNALLGVAQPHGMGFDVLHLNLHKTFATPHGSGGPGAGAVGVGEKLLPFLPVPVIDKKEEGYYLNYERPHSIGRLRSFYGNFLVLVRAYTYLVRLGREGLQRVSHHAVLNANYLREKLKEHYTLGSPKRCMHEVVVSCIKQKEKGASALDIAKRLIDYGIHPPTMYFPLIVKEALMIEPTETESKETLDHFIEAMIAIDKEIEESLETVKSAPHTAPVKRVDEIKAARFPDLRWSAQKNVSSSTLITKP